MNVCCAVGLLFACAFGCVLKNKKTKKKFVMKKKKISKKKFLSQFLFFFHFDTGFGIYIQLHEGVGGVCCAFVILFACKFGSSVLERDEIALFLSCWYISFSQLWYCRGPPWPNIYVLRLSYASLRF